MKPDNHMTGIDFHSSEPDLFRPMVARFLEQEILPHYDTWERNHLMPRDVWRTLGAAGLLLVDMPEQYGATGADFTVAMMIQEELGLQGLAGLGSSYNIHASIVPAYLAALGSEAQKQRWLPPMVTGEVVAALAMTEPGAGSDVAGIRCHARRDGDSYVINGSKTFITNGVHADLVLLAAKTDPTAGARGISLFLVDTSLPGFDRGQKIEKIGQHSSDTAELFFNDMKLPEDALLGAEGQGFVHMMQELPRERLGCAVQAVAHTQAALALTSAYALERQVFGQALSQFQNTRFKLAEAKTELEMCRALLEKHLLAFRAGDLSADDAALLKLACTEAQVRIINECLQLFGGYGYTEEYAISRFYRDARVQTIYAGSSEIMKEIVARTLVGR